MRSGWRSNALEWPGPFLITSKTVLPINCGALPMEWPLTSLKEVHDEDLANTGDSSIQRTDHSLKLKPRWASHARLGMSHRQSLVDWKRWRRRPARHCSGCCERLARVPADYLQPDT